MLEVRDSDVPSAQEGADGKVGRSGEENVRASALEATTSPSHSSTTESERLVPPRPTSKPLQLCGYLSKASRGPLKTWRKRWFVLEEHQCCLFYYNSKSDFTPQGNINISNALFSYSVEGSTKHQFEIKSDGQVHFLQASSREAMLYWLEQLQIRRRNFSKQEKSKYFNTDVAIPQSSCREFPTEEAETSRQVESAEHNQREFQPSNPRGRFSIRKQITGMFWPGQTTQMDLHSEECTSHSEANPKGAVDSDSKDKSDYEREVTTNSEYHVTETSPSTPPEPPRIPLTRKFFSKVTGPLLSAGQTSTKCVQCQLTRSKVEDLEQELEHMKHQLDDRDAVNEFLRKEIRLADMKHKIREEFSTTSGDSTPEDKMVEILAQRDQAIAEYERVIEEVTMEKDSLSKEIENKEAEVRGLREQINLFTEAVAAKDHVVVELTNKLFQLEHNGQVSTDPQEAMRSPTVQSLEIEVKKLTETVEAYKTQNHFFSCELLEINKLRGDDLAINKQLIYDYHELEAKFIQLESKYLVVLRQLKEPQDGAELATSTALVSQMMEEALLQDDNKGGEKDRSRSFDEYGFCHSQHDTLAGDEDLLKIKERKNAVETLRILDDMDIQHKLQWEVLWSQTVGTRHLTRSAQLKQLIRKGIPREYRPAVWKWIVVDSLKRTYQPGMYAELIKKHVDQTSIAMNQIELDLYRTLPTHKYYRSEGEWINKLRRVLVAFSWYDTSVGYCQGLNRLAAIALIFLDEEHAFWCLVLIVHHRLPRDYYDRSLLGSQADQRVLKDILNERAPALTQHLANCDIDFSLVTFNWFHTIFVDTMPSNTMLHIWDTFLYEGSKVLFRYAVAIFLYNKDDIIAEENSIAIFNKLRNMCKEATDIRRLTEIAFYDITRFSMDAINRKRDFYYKQIKEEIVELDRLRAAVAPQNTQDHNYDSEEELCEQ